MQIHPCLWFTDQAEQAAELYVSVVPDSRVVAVVPAPGGVPGAAGAAMVVGVELGGHRVQLLNGRPGRGFTDAMSLSVTVDTQDELDQVWDGLLAGGGTPVMCGWLTDRFGVSWQVVPRVLEELGSQGGERHARAMQALMGMVKLDIARLRAAADGQPVA